MASKNKSTSNSGQNLVHIKLDFQEAVDSKKNLLLTKANFLRTNQNLKSYIPLRKEELNQKIKLRNRLRELKKDLTSLDATFPTPKIPHILDDHLEHTMDESDEGESVLFNSPPTEIEKTLEKTKSFSQDSDIASELEDIKRKLGELEEI